MAALVEDLPKSNGPAAVWRWLKDWLAASDPAYSRLRMASRALLTLLIAGAILAGFTLLVTPLPIAAYGLTVVISFTGSMAIRDKSTAEQIRSRTYAWAVATGCVFVASLLTPWPVIADVVFLVVIFSAVYARKFGPRWFAVGMIGFMAYFMGDYLRPAPGDIGWIAAAAAMALGVTQLVAGVLLRDDAERDFRRALVSIDQRLEAITRALLARPAVERGPMQGQLSALRDIVLMAEGFIPQGEEGSLAARGAASDLAIALFDLQLVTERLARASYLETPPVAMVEAVLAGRTPAETAEDGVAGHLLLRLRRARARLGQALGSAPSPAFVPVENVVPKAAGKLRDVAAGPGPLIAVEWQAPIQVTLACAIAMAAGLVASPTRWYWAVITAFIVFNNAKSRADTAMRALQRSGGTLAGLIGGTLLATLLHGQVVASAIGIPVLFFLAFYFLQVSYGVMIFFVTLALALLYGLMGSFSPDLLVERLIETVIGSVAGAGVAFLIFPARTADNAAAALDKYFAALRDVIGAAKGRATGGAEPLHLLARSRLLDRAYAELATAVRPIGGRWGAVTRFGQVRERLLILSGVVHWARVLARSLPPNPKLTAEQSGRIAELADDLAGRVDAAAGARLSFFERPTAAEAEAIRPRPPLAISEEADPGLALEVMSGLLARTTPARGV